MSIIDPARITLLSTLLANWSLATTDWAPPAGAATDEDGATSSRQAPDPGAGRDAAAPSPGSSPRVDGARAPVPSGATPGRDPNIVLGDAMPPATPDDVATRFAPATPPSQSLMGLRPPSAEPFTAAEAMPDAGPAPPTGQPPSPSGDGRQADRGRPVLPAPPAAGAPEHDAALPAPAAPAGGEGGRAERAGSPDAPAPGLRGAEPPPGAAGPSSGAPSGRDPEGRGPAPVSADGPGGAAAAAAPATIGEDRIGVHRPETSTEGDAPGSGGARPVATAPASVDPEARPTGGVPPRAAGGAPDAPAEIPRRARGEAGGPATRDHDLLPWSSRQDAVAEHRPASADTPVLRRDAVSDVDGWALPTLLPAGAAEGQVERAGVIASFILNAAMIPGWPPPRPFDVPEIGAVLDRLASGRAGAPDEEALSGFLAERGVEEGLLSRMRSRLSTSRRLRLLLAMAALWTTIEAVIDAIEQELLLVASRAQDGGGDAEDETMRRLLTA